MTKETRVAFHARQMCFWLEQSKIYRDIPDRRCMRKSALYYRAELCRVLGRKAQAARLDFRAEELGSFVEGERGAA